MHKKSGQMDSPSRMAAKKCHDSHRMKLKLKLSKDFVRGWICQILSNDQLVLGTSLYMSVSCSDMFGKLRWPVEPPKRWGCYLVAPVELSIDPCISFTMTKLLRATAGSSDYATGNRSLKCRHEWSGGGSLLRTTPFGLRLVQGTSSEGEWPGIEPGSTLWQQGLQQPP